MSERHCYGSFPNLSDCPEECPGAKSKWLPDNYSGEGYYVQLCPNPARAGHHIGAINYCGNGPDVLIFYQAEFPPDEEIYDNTDLL